MQWWLTTVAIEEVGEAAAIGDARDRDGDEEIINVWIL